MKFVKLSAALLGIVLVAPLASAQMLDVNNAAAMGGSGTACSGGPCGLEVIFNNDGSNAFVRDETPDNETIYRCQFWLDANTWDASTTPSFFIIARATDETGGLRAAFQVMMVKKFGLWRLWLRAVNNPGTVRFTNRINLQPGTPSLVQVEWEQGDTPGSLSGNVTMSIIDGYNVGQSVSTALNNSTLDVDSFVMGAFQASPEQSGSIYLDEFESYRTLAP